MGEKMRHRYHWFAVAVVVLALAGPAYAVCPAGPTLILPGPNPQVNESGTVTLKWSAVSGAQDYDVYFGPSPSGCLAPVATEGGTTFQPPPGDVDPGATYNWKVV